MSDPSMNQSRDKDAPMKPLRSIIIACLLMSIFAGCATTGLTGNDEGSMAINAAEGKEYQKAINRCYKTGGTRVVKIEGRLRCF
jgi:hypothetical protein